MSVVSRLFSLGLPGSGGQATKAIDLTSGQRVFSDGFARLNPENRSTELARALQKDPELALSLAVNYVGDTQGNVLKSPAELWLALKHAQGTTDRDALRLLLQEVARKKKLPASISDGPEDRVTLPLDRISFGENNGRP